MLEIPVSYKSISHKGLAQIESGSMPFVIPDKAYDNEKGLLIDLAKPELITSKKLSI